MQTMQLIDLIFNLPDDLIIHLLSTWWNWLDISHLDRSLVNHTFREKCQIIFASHSIVLNSLGDYEINKMKDENPGGTGFPTIAQFSFITEDQSYLAKLLWLRDRNLQLQEMMVGCSVSALFMKKVYPVLGIKVRLLSYKTAGVPNINFRHAHRMLSPWLNLCPSLHSFSTDLGFDNDVLLTWLQSKLMFDQLLKLTLTSKVKANDLQIIRQTLPNLQSLHLIVEQDRIRPSRKHFISANKFLIFHDLIHLHDLACNYVTCSPTRAADTSLDTATWTTLRTLNVPLDNGVALEFAKRCPNLQLIIPNDESFIDPITMNVIRASPSSLQKWIDDIFHHQPHVKIKHFSSPTLFCQDLGVLRSMEKLAEALQVAEQVGNYLGRNDDLGDDNSLLQAYSDKVFSVLRNNYYVAVSKRWYLRWKRFLELDQSPSHYWDAKTWKDAYPTGFDDISAASAEETSNFVSGHIQEMSNKNDILRKVFKSGLLLNQDFILCDVANGKGCINHYFKDPLSIPSVQCFVDVDGSCNRKLEWQSPTASSVETVRIAKVFSPILIDYTYHIFGKQVAVFPTPFLSFGETFDNYSSSSSLTSASSCSLASPSLSSSPSTPTLTIISCLCDPSTIVLNRPKLPRKYRFQILSSLKEHFSSLWIDCDHPDSQLYDHNQQYFYTKMNGDHHLLREGREINEELCKVNRVKKSEVPTSSINVTTVDDTRNGRLLTNEQIDILYYSAKGYEKLNDNISFVDLMQRKYGLSLASTATDTDYRMVSSSQPTQIYHLQVMVELNSSLWKSSYDHYKREVDKVMHAQEIQLKDLLQYTFDRLWSVIQVNDWVDVSIIDNAQSNQHTITAKQKRESKAAGSKTTAQNISYFQAMVRSIEVMMEVEVEGQSGGDNGRKWRVVLQRGNVKRQQLDEQHNELINVHYREEKPVLDEQPMLYPLYSKTDPSTL